jgi:hypothetical protein
MRRAFAVVGVVAALGASGGAAWAATSTAPRPQVARDAKGDVADGSLDLTRVSLKRTSDGRLQASLTLASAWDGTDPLASSGPPGSLCLKAWTTTTPPDTIPDWLVCVTADRDGALRGSILQERANKLPARTAGADVTQPSERTVTLRFSQTAIGRPATLYVAAEATRPGCTRGSCVDLAPDAPKYLTFKLRETSAK